MKISSIAKIKLSNPVDVYDMIDVTPNHNFLIKTQSKGQYVISHNC